MSEKEIRVPMYLLLEGVHWLDSTSSEIATQIQAAIVQAGIEGCTIVPAKNDLQ